MLNVNTQTELLNVLNTVTHDEGQDFTYLNNDMNYIYVTKYNQNYLVEFYSIETNEFNGLEFCSKDLNNVVNFIVSAIDEEYGQGYFM